MRCTSHVVRPSVGVTVIYDGRSRSSPRARETAWCGAYLRRGVAPREKSEACVVFFRASPSRALFGGVATSRPPRVHTRLRGDAARAPASSLCRPRRTRLRRSRATEPPPASRRARAAPRSHQRHAMTRHDTPRHAWPRAGSAEAARRQSRERHDVSRQDLLSLNHQDV